MDTTKIEIQKVEKLIIDRKNKLSIIKKRMNDEFNENTYEYIGTIYDEHKKELLKLENQLKKLKLIEQKTLIDTKKNLFKLKETFNSFNRFNKDPLIKRSLVEIEKQIKNIEKILK